MSTEKTDITKDMEAQIKAQQLRIEELEKQLEKPSFKEVKVSVADMNQMYSNHLNTIDTTLAIISFAILIGGGLFGWIGFTAIRNMIENKLDDEIKGVTAQLMKNQIEPLQAEYKKIIEHQEKQDAELKSQKEEVSLKLEVEHNFSLAGRHYQEKKYKEAIAALNKVIQLNPNYVLAYVNRGLMNIKLEKYESAIEDYTKAIQLGVDDSNVSINNIHINRGVAYARLNQYELAIKDYDKAIELEPDDSHALMNRGVAYAKLGKFDLSVKGYDRAIELDSDNAGAYFNKACVYTLLKKSVDEILSLLKKAISLDEKFKEKAQTDEDFESIRDNEEFRKLVGLE